MLVLAIDTSSAAILAGVVELGVDDPADHPIVRAAQTEVDGRRHGELLAPAIATVLRDAGITPADLGAVVAGLGPGPFTGLRVGLVTAASFADACGVPAYGVCSLDAVAAQSTVDRPVTVVTDARRKEVYWARYDPAGARVDGPSVNRPSDVDTGGAFLMGAGVALYPDIFGVPVGVAAYPDLAALVALAADRLRTGAPGEVLSPLYLRRPDAVVPASLAARS